MYATLDTHLFFWSSSSPFSNFYPSKFVENGIEYNCSEQYFMAKKAERYKDYETLKKILNEKIPSKIKLYGRQVKNFDQKDWSLSSLQIMEQGNYLKFSQNSILKSMLRATGDKILVEASPKDKIWGIGLDENTALETPIDKWIGENKLGIALMNVRKKLV